MNADDTQTKQLEERASAVLQDSVTRVNSRVRSRLNQARQAALEERAAHRRSFWRGPIFVPAGAVAAVALVALLLTTHLQTDHAMPGEGGQAIDDIELLADSEGLDLVENWDGNFYEWAAQESDDGDGTSG